MQETVQIAEAESGEESDPFRETLLRYWGYANEVGESFAAQAPKMVGPSYGMAYGYVAADTAFQTYEEWKHDDGVISPKMLVAGGDCLIWQTLASVVIPGYFINRVVWATTKVLENDNIPELPEKAMSYGPTAAGLGAIPFIVGPIDKGVNTLMDLTYRTLF